MFKRIKSWFQVRSENAKLRKELIENEIFLQNIKNNIVDLELRFQDMVLLAISTLLEQDNNEHTVKYNFINSEQIRNLKVQYDFQSNGDVKYWLETVARQD